MRAFNFGILASACVSISCTTQMAIDEASAEEKGLDAIYATTWSSTCSRTGDECTHTGTKVWRSEAEYLEAEAQNSVCSEDSYCTTYFHDSTSMRSDCNDAPSRASIVYLDGNNPAATASYNKPDGNADSTCRELLGQCTQWSNASDQRQCAVLEMRSNVIRVDGF